MSHLTSEQRYTIAAMYAQSYKQKEITVAIGKDPSVVSRELKLLVDSLLQANYSPEQIKGRISLLIGVIVSPETIYKYIWQNKKQGGSLYTFLRHNGKKHRKRGAAKDNRGILRNQVSINKRPDSIDQKSRFGDLEIDTVIGKNHKGALLTINDRQTGLVWIR